MVMICSILLSVFILYMKTLQTIRQLRGEPTKANERTWMNVRKQEDGSFGRPSSSGACSRSNSSVLYAARKRQTFSLLTFFPLACTLLSSVSGTTLIARRLSNRRCKQLHTKYCVSSPKHLDTIWCSSRIRCLWLREIEEYLHA